jgi:hypothetical protein
MLHVVERRTTIDRLTMEVNDTAEQGTAHRDEQGRALTVHPAATAQPTCGINGNGLYRRAIQMGMHDCGNLLVPIELAM